MSSPPTAFALATPTPLHFNSHFLQRLPRYSRYYLRQRHYLPTYPSGQTLATVANSVNMVTAAPTIPDVLQKIVARKKNEVEAFKRELDSAGAEDPVKKAIANRGSFEREKLFGTALKLRFNTLTVIAEVKRRSPSKGVIGRIPDAGHLSRVYWEGGAAAVSVLTDGESFGGGIDDLKRVVEMQERFRAAGRMPPCPVLRKEFIIDEVQIAEAKACGASAVLLIVAVLGDQTKEFIDMCHEYGLDALVEVHDEKEVEVAVNAGAEIIGVNNRDLRTFEVSLDTAIHLQKLIPEHIITVAESGIKECRDAWILRDAGFNAVLVGESLVRAHEDSLTHGTGYSGGFDMAKGMIRAFKAKGSVKYGPRSSAAFFGKGEGASESLGELSI